MYKCGGGQCSFKGSVGLEREKLGFQWDVDFLLKEKLHVQSMC